MQSYNKFRVIKAAQCLAENNEIQLFYCLAFLKFNGLYDDTVHL